MEYDVESLWRMPPWCQLAAACHTTGCLLQTLTKVSLSLLTIRRPLAKPHLWFPSGFNSKIKEGWDLLCFVSYSLKNSGFDLKKKRINQGGKRKETIESWLSMCGNFYTPWQKNSGLFIGSWFIEKKVGIKHSLGHRLEWDLLALVKLPVQGRDRCLRKSERAVKTHAES